MYLPIPYKIHYDTTKYPLKELIQEILEVKEPLESLHLLKHYDKLVRETDQSTQWHRRYYDKFHSRFYPTYKQLVEDIKYKFEYTSIVYQKVPTFRVQLADGNIAVGEWHKDKAYNHGSSEVNFWLPFTNTNELNSVWIESKEDLGDFRPYTVNYGEILVFNGANLLHGNKANTSDSTRVSIDFRLVDPIKFKPSTEGSINMKSKFDIGGYFELI